MRSRQAHRLPPVHSAVQVEESGIITLNKFLEDKDGELNPRGVEDFIDPGEALSLGAVAAPLAPLCLPRTAQLRCTARFLLLKCLAVVHCMCLCFLHSS